MSKRTHWVLHLPSLVLLVGVGIFIAFPERTHALLNAPPDGDGPEFVTAEPNE